MRYKSKKMYVVFVIVALLCVSVGYAVLNSTLIINGKSNISKNTWNVHFENIMIRNGSITASVEPAIINNTTISNFELTLDKPGDFYEFTVDVKNSGTIDAMIDSVVKTPNLTDTQKKYIDYIVEYQNGEDILKNQLVKANELVRIKVRVAYKNDLSSSDLPSSAEILTLGLDINYVQADDSGIEVFGKGFISVDGDINEIGTVVTIGTEKFYTIGTEAGTVKLLSMYNLYVGGSYAGNSWTIYGEEATGMQESDMRGWVSGQSVAKGTTKFSDYSQKGTNYSDYEGSIVEKYVNNYKSEIEKMSVEVVDARLITKEELTSEKIGCSSSGCSSNVPNFIYSTSYWTGSSDDTKHIWYVVSTGALGNIDYNLFSSYGVRPVIVISLSELDTSLINPVADGDINEIGTVVTIGTEQFYTIGTEGDNVKLLSKYNLYVGNEVTDVNVDDEGNELHVMNELFKPTGMQRYNAKGAVYDSNLKEIYPWIGTTSFSSEEKHGTNYSDYSGSIVEGYVNNYKNLLENKFDVDISNSRLINGDELIKLFSNADSCWEGSNSICFESLYPWVNSSSYWTGQAFSDDIIYAVVSAGLLETCSYYLNFGLGVRPVIEISKEYFR